MIIHRDRADRVSRRRYGAILRLFLAVAVLGVALAGFRAPAHADHQVVFEQAPYGRLDQYNPVIRELRQTGVFRWRYVQDPGGIDRLGAVAQALDEISAEFGVYMLPDPSGFPIFSSGGADFIYGNNKHGACGSWAIGCVTEFPTDPKIVVDAAAMAGWPLRSILEVLLHELFHELGNFAEGYRESYVYGVTSCAPVDDGGVVAGIHRSLMNCGLFNAQVIDSYIRFAWAYSHYPAPVAGAAYSGGVVWYARTTANATRLAIIVQTQGFDLAFIGYAPACYTAGIVCGGVQLALPPATCVWVKSENALSWARTDNRVLAGCNP